MKRLVLVLFFLLSYVATSQTKYVVYTDGRLIEKSRELLYLQVGVREKTNNNDGPEVEKYLKSVGGIRGYAWCNALQYYVYWASCIFYEIDKKKIPMYRSCLANDTYKYAINKGTKVAFIAEIDDFLVWKFPNNNKGHIGRVIKVEPKGWVTTIEGNTKVGAFGNDREGGGVGKKRRNLYHPLNKMNVRGLVGVKPFLDTSSVMLPKVDIDVYKFIIF